MKQENKPIFIAVLLFLTSLFFFGCSGTRKLPEGTYLYTGANVAIEATGRVPNRSRLESELEDLVRPDPNSSLFGMRPMVWLHNSTRDTADSGWLKKWLHRMGEPPVLLDRANPTNSSNLIQNRLYNQGYFEAEVDHDVVQKRKTAYINYTARVVSPYRIDTIVFPDPTDALSIAIVDMQQESLLKQNDTYNVDKLTEERQRVSRGVRDKGFYLFAPEHMIFRVDSTLGERRVKIFLTVKEDLPNEVLTQFTLNTITINPNYSFMLDTIDKRADTVNVGGYNYILNNRDIRPQVIVNSMFLMPDSLYSRTGHEQTINRMMRLGVFQYANIRFDRPKNGNTLNAILHLTPMRKRSIRTELQWVNSSFFTGPNFSVSHLNRNFLRGAELFELRLSSGIEFGTGGEQSSFTSYNFGVESSIHFPRFVLPFFDIRNKSSYYVPQTRLRLAYQRINRVEFFTVNSFNVIMGYFWNETRKVRHDFNLIDINFFQLVDTTKRFHELYQRFPFIQRNYQEQFILGTNYSYTINTQLGEWRIHNFYFNGFLDVSGNLMQLFQKSISGNEPNADGTYTIFNRAYSQFARFSTDFRYFYAVDRKNTIATRLFIGIGVPYGNSTSMPFIKQFFSGGTNSVRAFAARSIGPGLVTPEENLAGFYDQLGDMKLEVNLEYRFPIYGFFKGGLFLEAGNIWMISEEAEPEARFHINKFMDQLAVGTGFGLRLDVEFFLLRFDFGVPLRVPQGWVWKPLPPAVDRNWNNITFNIGIGYSF